MSIFDRFLKNRLQGARGSVDPPRRVENWVPDDSVDLPFVTTAYRVIVAEDLTVMMANEDTVTIPAAALLAGYQYSGQLKRIYNTGSGNGHTQVIIEGPD